MPVVAEIVTIGTELLLGEIVDTNARFLARRLRDVGVNLYRMTTVGDNVQRIADALREALARADVVLTTGGLGPTVDDPTREAVARATGRPLVFRQDLWDALVARYARYGRVPSENNKRQAYVPAGARVLPNPVGTAPAFAVETEQGVVISLPGVPREMETIFDQEVLPYLRERFGLRGVIRARVLHTAGVSESLIDERIADLEQLSNPTVGLAAHPAQVDVRITAKAEDEAQAEAMIRQVEEEIRRRLGPWIYGADEETLEQVVLRHLQQQGQTLVVVESGLQGELVRRLTPLDGPVLGGEVLPPVGREELQRAAEELRRSKGADVALAVLLIPGGEMHRLWMLALTPQGQREKESAFPGPPGLAPRWAVNMALEHLRRALTAPAPQEGAPSA